MSFVSPELSLVSYSYDIIVSSYTYPSLPRYLLSKMSNLSNKYSSNYNTILSRVGRRYLPNYITEIMVS